MELDQAEARARLAAARSARLATASADGQPHLVPITFALDDERLYFAVDHKPKRSTALRRLRNIAGNPRVSVLADEYAEDWSRLWWVRADGRAEVWPPDEGDGGGSRRAAALRLLAARYPQYRERPPRGAVVAIRIDRLTGWAAGGG
jgi:PPOX class probable F420-dependent enzyme